MATLDWLSSAEAKAALNLAGVTTYDDEITPWNTAASLLLDSYVGPAVVRTVTDEAHDGNYPSIRTRLYPVKSITTLTEYVSTTGTVLTVETNASKPASGYLAERYDPAPTLYSGRLFRRSSGSPTCFPCGTGNIVITYEAGRFTNTAAVDERFKSAARLTLQNLWNSQRPNLAQIGEFEIPQSNWPRFAVPNAVREMLADVWQKSPLGELLVG
jgi:hypothetical protein